MNVNGSSTQSYRNVYPHVRQDRRNPELSGENAEPDLGSCSHSEDKSSGENDAVIT